MELYKGKGWTLTESLGLFTLVGPRMTEHPEYFKITGLVTYARPNKVPWKVKEAVLTAFRKHYEK